MDIDIKQALTKNNITQEKFAQYLGITRVALNKNLNNSKPKKSLINNLKLMIAESRGLKIDIEL